MASQIVSNSNSSFLTTLASRTKYIQSSSNSNSNNSEVGSNKRVSIDVNEDKRAHHRAQASWADYVDDDLPPPVYTISSAYVPPHVAFDDPLDPYEHLHHHGHHSITPNGRNKNPYDAIYISSNTYGEKTKSTSNRNPYEEYYTDMRNLNKKPLNPLNNEQQTFSASNTGRIRNQQKIRNPLLDSQKNTFQTSIYEKELLYNKKNKNGNENELNNLYEINRFPLLDDDIPNCARESVLPVCSEDNDYPV